MFGGSNASAYMLLYRQKAHNKQIKPDQKPEIPAYWLEEIKNLNQKEEEMRQNYEDLKQQFDLILQEADAHFNTDPASSFVSYIKDEQLDE